MRTACDTEGDGRGRPAALPSRAWRTARAGGRAGDERRCPDSVIRDWRYPPPASHQRPQIVNEVGGGDVGTWRDGTQLCAADSPMSGLRLDADLPRRAKRARSPLVIRLKFCAPPSVSKHCISVFIRFYVFQRLTLYESSK